MRRGARDACPPSRARRGRGREDQPLRPAAARRAHRAHLRPQRPGRHHHQHGAAQHGDGRAADLLHPVAVPGRPAQRADRGGHHPLRAALRRGDPGAVAANSANLLSIGAIDFGIIVDATVIMVENIFRHLADASHAVGRSRGRRRASMTGKIATIYRASSEVTQAIFFAATIIIAGFLPLFTLSGVEGHIFGPMAKTYAYALSGGLLATFTVSPALSALLLPDKVSESRDRSSCAGCAGSTARSSRVVLAHRGLTLARRRRAGRLAGLAASSVGLEFLPKLEEGNIWMRAALPPSVSLEEGNAYVNRMRGLIKGFPEVETVISQHGRPDDGTDPDGFSNVEFFVPLKPLRAVAQGPRQGRADRARWRGALRTRLPRRQLRLLAIHPGQRPGGGLGHRRARTPSRSAAPTSSTLSKVADGGPPRAGEGAAASPTSRCRRCSASRPSASTSTASAPRATACRRATSTPPSRPRSAARRRATSTRTAATATSR